MYVPSFGMYVPNLGMYVPKFGIKLSPLRKNFYSTVQEQFNHRERTFIALSYNNLSVMFQKCNHYALWKGQTSHQIMAGRIHYFVPLESEFVYIHYYIINREEFCIKRERVRLLWLKRHYFWAFCFVFEYLSLTLSCSRADYQPAGGRRVGAHIWKRRLLDALILTF